MKNLLLLIAAVFSLLPLRAQSYVPFPEKATMWTEIYRYSEFYPYSLHYYRFGNGDTVVYGKTYRPLYRADDTFFTNAAFAGGLRQDTAARKVYFCTTAGEMLLYDFSVGAGDTVKGTANGNANNWHNDLIVHSIDSVLIDGSYRRRINLRMSFSPNFDILPSAWVEGLGNQVRGVIFPSGNMPNNGKWNELICMHQNGRTAYHNTTDWNKYDAENSVYADCPVPSPQAVAGLPEAAMRAQVLPNPVSGTGRLMISPAYGFSRLAIFDAMGRKRLSLNVSGRTEIKLEQRDFTAGTYIYLLTNDKGLSAHGLFTVK